ncbi:hypothetical protein BD769DRAFT_1503013 [Suillus cothurnatus]|nr:hypothetical protein BD769DRAFT_1503013 [Suillus cothurnatus]
MVFPRLSSMHQLIFMLLLSLLTWCYTTSRSKHHLYRRLTHGARLACRRSSKSPQIPNLLTGIVVLSMRMRRTLQE